MSSAVIQYASQFFNKGPPWLFSLPLFHELVLWKDRVSLIVIDKTIVMIMRDGFYLKVFIRLVDTAVVKSLS